MISVRFKEICFLGVAVVLASLFLSVNKSIAKNPQPDNTQCAEACTFVLYKQGQGIVHVVNKHRAQRALPPFSTFKIPNTLIALETGEVASLEQVLDFDRSKTPIQAWWPKSWYREPMPITAAFARSALPIYQELARGIGKQRMQAHLDRFDYGNRDITAGIDRFWLNASLQISALEQVEFLKCLFEEDIELSEHTRSALEQIMLAEQTAEYRLFAKTGGGPTAENRALGWYVGRYDTAKNRYYFALNIDGKNFAAVKQKRIDLAMALLAKHARE